MKSPVPRINLLTLLIIAAPLTYGCNVMQPVSDRLNVDQARSQKLMALAAEEAGKIADANMRLARQLNLADLQIDRDWTDNARETLAAARRTLGSAEAGKLNDHARISGWVSISELSRRVRDPGTAAAATDAALREMDRIEDPGKRCEYVMGLSNELQYIKGKPAAAGLLSRAGPWTNSIDNLGSRRQALIAFSTALFNLDDFSNGQKMLEQESDPAWRSDVLASMAQIQPAGQLTYAMESAASRSPMPALPPTTQPFFGKPLDFDQVFKNQKSAHD